MGNKKGKKRGGGEPQAELGGGVSVARLDRLVGHVRQGRLPAVEVEGVDGLVV